MKRITVQIFGEVQSVGYREAVRKLTFKTEITGYIRNLDSGDVEIIAEGHEETLKTFLERIQISDYPIDVQNITVSWDTAYGEFTRFIIIRGEKDQELFERMDVAGTYLYKILENTSTSLTKQDLMLDKQDQMLNKQDQMLNKQDQMLNKQDQMLNLQSDTIKEVTSLRGDMKSYMDTEFVEIKRKLQSIEDALGRAGIKV